MSYYRFSLSSVRFSVCIYACRIVNIYFSVCLFVFLSACLFPYLYSTLPDPMGSLSLLCRDIYFWKYRTNLYLDHGFYIRWLLISICQLLEEISHFDFLKAFAYLEKVVKFVNKIGKAYFTLYVRNLFWVIILYSTIVSDRAYSNMMNILMKIPCGKLSSFYHYNCYCHF